MTINAVLTKDQMSLMTKEEARAFLMRPANAPAFRLPQAAPVSLHSEAKPKDTEEDKALAEEYWRLRKSYFAPEMAQRIILNFLDYLEHREDPECERHNLGYTVTLKLHQHEEVFYFSWCHLGGFRDSADWWFAIDKEIESKTLEPFASWLESQGCMIERTAGGHSIVPPMPWVDFFRTKLGTDADIEASGLKEHYEHMSVCVECGDCEDFPAIHEFVAYDKADNVSEAKACSTCA